MDHVAWEHSLNGTPGFSAEASDSTAVKHMGQRDIEIDHVLRDGSLNGGLDRVLR
jgi:hypothetical protein